MDKDHTGTIDWWEFLNHEALKSIAANRSKVRRLKTFKSLYIPCHHILPALVSDTVTSVM